MSECFVCGHRLLNINLPCPKCGYIFDTDINDGCPNKEDKICLITGRICEFNGTFYNECHIKNEVDKEVDY